MVTLKRLVVGVSERDWVDFNHLKLNKHSNFSGYNIKKKSIIYTTVRLYEYIFKWGVLDKYDLAFS